LNRISVHSRHLELSSTADCPEITSPPQDLMWSLVVITALLRPSPVLKPSLLHAPSHQQRKSLLFLAMAMDREIASGDDSNTSPASAEVFAGMKSPVLLDTPEGQEMLARLQRDDKTTPPGPPTALASEVFAGMQMPILLESPEGKAALARMERESDDDTEESAESKEPPEESPSREKVRQLLDSLGEEQVRAILASEGMPLDMIESVVKGAQGLPPAGTPSPPKSSTLAPSSSPMRAPKQVDFRAPPPPTSATKVIRADEKLYPMPEGVAPEAKQIFLPFVPFGIAPGALAISSLLTVLVLGVFGYLLSLTS
jgi:hypothetical protein